MPDGSAPAPEPTDRTESVPRTAQDRCPQDRALHVLQDLRPILAKADSQLRTILAPGPSLANLHLDYARRGRIDQAAPVCGRAEIEIDAPVGTVWRMFSDMARWPTWSASIHHVRVEHPLRVGSRFLWWNGPVRFLCMLSVVETDQELTWTGIGLGNRAVHRNLFSSTDSGGTRVRSEESLNGVLLPSLYSGTRLCWDLESWLTELKFAVEDRGRRTR
ncbi:MAG: hypothetical protein QG608_1596 [Actinomycetota bacterium]|nr:hypothetical protein [Actinomycetota bacterium]